MLTPRSFKAFLRLWHIISAPLTRRADRHVPAIFQLHLFRDYVYLAPPPMTQAAFSGGRFRPSSKVLVRSRPFTG